MYLIRLVPVALVALASLWSPGVGSADGPVMYPAQFGTHDQSIVNLLDCPDGQGKEDRNVAVFCQIEVSADGASRNGKTFCFGNTDSPPGYSIAAADAARAATYQPALVDEKPVDVMFNFRVLFMQQAGSCRVAAVPNPGFQAEDLGMAYYAPQEIVSEASWIQRSGIGREGGTQTSVVEQKGMMFLLSVDVDEQGKTRGGEVVRNNFGSRREASRSLRAARSATYIPGFVGGEPKPMKYFGFIYFNAETQPRQQNPLQRQSFIG